MRKKSRVELLETPVSFKEAPEPTNIIWENRHRGFFARTFRKIVVLALVALFLAGTVVIFFFLK